MYAPAYAGAAVAEAKAKAKASMAKYLASLVKREEEGWTVLAAEVPQAPDERFFSSADELEQAPLIPAKRKAEDEPMEDVSPGVAQVPKALTRPPGAFLELLNPPEEDVPMEELLAKDEEELPMSDTKWQRRRELMAKSREQASSEEDENPAAPPPGGSVFTKALKVSEGLYQVSEDQMSGDFPCFDATTATRLRRLQAKDVQRLLRGFEGPQLKQGGLERVVEAFYIAKMKYEHEALLSTPGQQAGKRAGLGYGGLENRPLGKEPTSWICPMPWVKKGARKCMGCGKKTEPIDTANNLATLEMAGTHWQLTVDDQGNAVWTAARSAGAEGPDTDRARDLKLSASVDVSELATDPMACENPDQASFSDFVPSSVRAVIRNCPMELDEDFLKAPMGERPPLPGDKEEGQECRAFHPAAVKAFKIQTRLNATTIAQEEAKQADQVAAVERSAAVLHELQGGAIDGGGDGGQLLKNLDLDLFREKLLDKLGADWGRPTPELLQAQTTAEEAKAKHQARQASRPECSSPSSLPSVRGRTRPALPLRRGSLSRPRRGGTSAWMTSRPSRTLTSKPRRSSRWEGTPFRRPS